IRPRPLPLRPSAYRPGTCIRGHLPRPRAPVVPAGPRVTALACSVSPSNAIFVTKRSEEKHHPVPSPPLNCRWKAPRVVGKSAEVVQPSTYRFSKWSSSILVPNSSLLPPRYVEKISPETFFV